MTAQEKPKEHERLERWTAENPRDDLALALFAAWVNCPVDKLPPEMRGHTCPATMQAWSRVADIPAAHIEELEARFARLLDMAGPLFDAAQQVHRDGGHELARLVTDFCAALDKDNTP